MLRVISVVSIALLCSACISHPAQYENLTVTLVNDVPCFGIPGDLKFREALFIYEPSVMKRVDEQWETVFSPHTSSPLESLTSGECISWKKVDWQTGEYDVVVKVIRDNNSKRYAARFIFNKDKNGVASLIKIE